MKRLGWLFVLPLVWSCLELDVDVKFRTSTSGEVRIEALEHRLGQGLTFTEGDDRGSWPRAREDWEQVVQTVAGLSLVSYEAQETDQGRATVVLLGFSQARALEGLFVVFRQKLTLLADVQGRWTLTWQPQVPRVSGADAETRRLWSAVWGPLTWEFRFTPPGRPTETRRLTLTELADTQIPAEWSLRW